MVRFFHARYFRISRRRNVTILAFALCFGFIAGSATAFMAYQPGHHFITNAAQSSVSYLGLLSVMILPLVFIAFAAYIGQIWLLIPIASIKAFLFSYCCACVLRLYCASGWLILVLLLFADCFSITLLCWVCIRVINHGRQMLFRSFLVSSILLAGITFLDYRYISPFLVKLLS